MNVVSKGGDGEGPNGHFSWRGDDAFVKNMTGSFLVLSADERATKSIWREENGMRRERLFQDYQATDAEIKQRCHHSTGGDHGPHRWLAPKSISSVAVFPSLSVTVNVTK
jgi:hypothetical protein